MCWLFHQWGKWELYEERGILTFGWGKNRGEKAEYSETRQRRKCQDCGKTQDEVVKRS